jgi:hypothetical protein
VLCHVQAVASAPTLVALLWGNDWHLFPLFGHFAHAWAPGGLLTLWDFGGELIFQSPLSSRQRVSRGLIALFRTCDFCGGFLTQRRRVLRVAAFHTRSERLGQPSHGFSAAFCGTDDAARFPSAIVFRSQCSRGRLASIPAFWSFCTCVGSRQILDPLGFRRGTHFSESAQF